MLRRFVAFAAAVAITVASAAATAPGWEEVNAPQQVVLQQFDTDAGTDVVVRDGYIYIWTQRPVVVKLFSILGQQILQETIPAGIHRLRMTSKGIYILRAGSITRRITL